MTVVGARETVGSQVVQQTGIQCFNCKEFSHFAKECRKPKRVKDSTYHKEKMLLCKQAEKGVPLQAERFLPQTQELILSHWNSNTCLVEEDDSNVTFASPDMCDNDIQIDQNVEGECVVLANLIANLKLDVGENKKIQKQLKKANVSLTQELKECKSILMKTSRTLRESNSIRDSCLVALQNKHTEFERYKALNDRTVDYDKLERKLNETLRLLAQKEIDLKEALKVKAYEILVVKEKHDELVKQSLLTKSHFEGLVKEKTKIPYDQSDPANRLIPDREEILTLEKESRSKLNKDLVRPYDYTKLNSLYEIFKPASHEYHKQLAHANENDSFAFVHELKQEIHDDLKYVESLEKEIDELKYDKAEFSNMYDMLLQECVSNDVMCSYLHPLSDLDAHSELQCLYLHKVKECASLAQKLSKQTESVSKDVDTELLRSCAKLEKHSISLELALQQCQEQMTNDTVCKEKASNVFQKEREQYFQIQDLKAQLQYKNIAISELKKLVDKCKGKSMETKFDKLYVVRQPNAQRIPKPLVLGKPAPFSDSLKRKTFSQTKSVPKTNVSESLSKRVTTQILPQTARQVTSRNTNPRVSTSTGVIHNTNVSRPQLKSTQMKDKVMPNNSQVKDKKTEVEDHPRISSISNKTKSVTASNDSLKSRTLNVNAVCATCGKCVFNSNHDACVSKYLNDVNARTNKHKAVPISTRKPKSQANKSVATPHLQGNDLLIGNRGSDLNKISLQETTSSTPIYLMAKASPTQAWLWHRRLSHLNFDYINLLSKKDVVIGLPKLKYVKDQLCSSCEISKAKRSSFKIKIVPSSKGRLNLLHMDLCGPMRVASINGKKYILVIVDDYSRYT
ncbi:retrovirus-related pol polyprotein from transposon TNT 1-94 [Tanacetum coccineum]